MKWWNDLWLNESFAEWASTIATAEATEWTEAWTTFQAMEKSWAYRQDQLPSTHPIVATINDLEDVQVNFDGITYAKGGSVLKQLVAWVGIDAFFRRGLRLLQEAPPLEHRAPRPARRARGHERTRPVRVVEAVARDRRGEHAPPGIEVDESGVITSFAVLQEAPADHPTLRPHRLAIGVYAFEQDADAPFGADTASSGRQARAHPRVEIDVDGARTDVPELVGVHRGDLVLLNDDDLAYAKIRLDEQSRRTAIEHLAAIANPLARSIVWGAMWDATRDAESPASDYVRLVLGNIATETESTTIRYDALAAAAHRPELRGPGEVRRHSPHRGRDALAARLVRRGRVRRAVPVREVLRADRVHGRARRHPLGAARRLRDAERTRDRHRSALGAARGPRPRRSRRRRRGGRRARRRQDSVRRAGRSARPGDHPDGRGQARCVLLARRLLGAARTPSCARPRSGSST